MQEMPQILSDLLSKTSKDCSSSSTLTVWYKIKFGSQNLATNFGNHL